VRVWLLENFSGDETLVLDPEVREGVSQINLEEKMIQASAE
jgi:hypothetical protein